jgi:thiol-disulfide isomerase/thioredoxin
MKQILFGLIFCLNISFLSAQEIKKVKITDLEKTIAESKTPLIVNFWASWCKPCLEEIPYFMEEVNLHKKDSLQFLLVSLDMADAYPLKIRKAIKERKITFTVQWLDETDADYFCPKIDPKWSGAIPATLFVNNKTGFHQFFEGQVSHDDLKKDITATLETH